MQTASEITRLLGEWRDGDADAADRLAPLVYPELRRLAERHLRNEWRMHTWQPTELVSEAYLRLMAGTAPTVEDHRHFFSFASRVMRQILVDCARRRIAEKRGGGAAAEALSDWDRVASPEPEETVLALHEAIDQMMAFDERKARVIEMSYFGGMSMPEIAAVLGISAPTVMRDLRTAEAWLRRALNAPQP
ncbi:MAG TPA: ECF-type sigma factor [Bryobacteraceae bacterium]|nr:ECF-type sigma factor [Bryobacteraceae bacterium]